MELVTTGYKSYWAGLGVQFIVHPHTSLCGRMFCIAGRFLWWYGTIELHC